MAHSEAAGAAPDGRVSLCATLFNEAESIEAWLDSVLAQTRPPGEIVLCDAGSTDGTIERIESRAAGDERIRLLVEPGVNVPEGRNAAIAAAGNELIAITDAGTVLDPDWLRRLIEPLEGDSEVGVSAGFYRPAGRNAFEMVLATVITPRRRDLPDDGFPPSSRSVAFRRSWWERAGGYPEWLRAGEDLVFDYRLRDLGARFAFAPEALVAWYPRPDLREFFAQYRHYARGDGHGHLFSGRHAIRYCAYLAGFVLARRSRRSRLARGLLLLGVYLHMRKFLRRVQEERPLPGAGGMAASYALVPAIVVVGDVAKMVGYPQGLWERWRAGGPEGLQAARIQSHRASTRSARRRLADSATP
jgi:cellulose synthase/poly-beta-1,6-N-acetylglucosamine synthase-like glycosyltransferase